MHRGPLVTRKQTKKKAKGHAFFCIESKTIEIRDPADYLSSVALEEVHPQFADMVDEYYSHVESQPFVGIDIDTTSTKSGYERVVQLDHGYVRLNVETSNYCDAAMPLITGVAGFTIFNAETNTVEYTHDSNYSGGYSYYRSPSYDAREFPGLSRGDLRLLDLICKINAEWTETLTNDTVARHDYHQRNVLRSAILRKYGVGVLRYKLADGKLDNRHHM
jgi:hypothetical protein